MGIAAYNRGNKLISLQFQRAAGIPDPCYVADKRPKDWGSKAQRKAQECGQRIVASRKFYDLARPDEERLAMAIQHSTGVGVATARKAARFALETE